MPYFYKKILVEIKMTIFFRTTAHPCFTVKNFMKQPFCRNGVGRAEQKKFDLGVENVFF